MLRLRLTSPAYPADGTAIVMLTGTGVYRTFSNGLWWESQNTGMMTILRSIPRTIAFSPNYASDFLVMLGGGSGAFRSTDGGATWSAANSGITHTDVASYAFRLLSPRTVLYLPARPAGAYSNRQTVVSPGRRLTQALRMGR